MIARKLIIATDDTKRAKTKIFNNMTMKRQKDVITNLVNLLRCTKVHTSHFKMHSHYCTRSITCQKL